MEFASSFLFSEYDSLANNAMHVSRSIRNEQNVLVIQPYIKWGPKKSVIPAEIQLQEAEALIRSLDTWSIQQSLKIGLTTFDMQTFFGKGKLVELRNLVQQINNTGSQVNSTFVCSKWTFVMNCFFLLLPVR